MMNQGNSGGSQAAEKVTQAPAYCSKCWTRPCSCKLQIISQSKTQIGPVTVTFTVGRISK